MQLNAFTLAFTGGQRAREADLRAAYFARSLRTIRRSLIAGFRACLGFGGWIGSFPRTPIAFGPCASGSCVIGL